MARPKTIHRKLSDQQRQMAYEWYFAGTPVLKIQEKLLSDFNIKISERDIYYHLSELRKQQEENLDILMRCKLEDTLNRLDYWIKDLELIAPLYKSDPKVYLKFVEKISDMIKFKLTLGAEQSHKKEAETNEEAKAKIIAELEKL